MSKSIKILIGILVLIVVLFGGLIIIANINKDTDTADNTTEEPVAEKLKLEDITSPANPVATIEVEGYGTMVFELFPEYAPQSVANFVSLSNDDFYNGLTFHRIVEDFVVQGGDPDGNGTGGPGYSIFGEFTANGFENNLTHQKGAIAWARSQDNNSAGSQFYVVDNDSVADSLDGDYAVFGYMLSGEDILDEISAVEVDAEQKPVNDVIIKDITIEMNDYVQATIEKY